MDWDDLRYLLAVRRAGSLTRAAKTLRVDKATVGRRLAALAETLGAEVIEHVPRGVRLTRAGELAASTAEKPAGTLGSALYASRAYLRERGAPKTREDLRHHHLLAYETRVTFVPALGWLEQIGAPVSFRATDALALLEATAGGLGIAVLPCFLGDAEPQLERLDGFGLGHEEIVIVTHESARKSAGVRAAVEWLAQLWKKHAARLAGHDSPPQPAPTLRRGRR